MRTPCDSTRKAGLKYNPSFILTCIRGVFIVKRIRHLLLCAAACLAATASPALAQNEEIALIPVTELTNSNGATVRGSSYDGRRIVFESNNNYTGENADANFEYLPLRCGHQEIHSDY